MSHLHPCPEWMHPTASVPKNYRDLVRYLQRQPLTSSNPYGQALTWPHAGSSFWVPMPILGKHMHSNNLWGCRLTPVQWPLLWLPCQQLDVTAAVMLWQFRQELGISQSTTCSNSRIYIPRCVWPHCSLSE